MPVSNTRRRLGLGAVVVLLALAGCAQPIAPELCEVCQDPHYRATSGEAPGERYQPSDWHGVDNVTEERSVLHVHPRRDGSVRWVARIDLAGDGVDEIRAKANPGDWIADETDLDGTDAEVRDIEAHFEGETFVVAYATDGTVRRGVGGVLLFEEFFETDDLDGEPAYRLGADRVVLHAPEGTVVSNDPVGTERVSPSAVAWSADENQSVLAHTYVTFGPDGGVETWAASQATVAWAVGSWALEPLAVAAAIPELLVLLLVALVVLAADGSPVGLSTPGDDDWNDAFEVAGRKLPSPTVNPDAIRFPWELAVGLGASAVLALAFAGSFTFRLLGWAAFYLPVVPLGTMLVLGPTADRSPRLRRALVGFLLGSPVVAAVPPVLSFGGGGLFLVPLWILGFAVGGILMALGWVGSEILFGGE